MKTAGNWLTWIPIINKISILCMSNWIKLRNVDKYKYIKSKITKILNSEEYLIGKFLITLQNHITKHTKRMDNDCHNPDFVQAFPNVEKWWIEPGFIALNLSLVQQSHWIIYVFVLQTLKLTHPFASFSFFSAITYTLFFKGFLVIWCENRAPFSILNRRIDIIASKVLLTKFSLIQSRIGTQLFAPFSKQNNSNEIWPWLISRYIWQDPKMILLLHLLQLYYKMHKVFTCKHMCLEDTFPFFYQFYFFCEHLTELKQIIFKW